MKKDLEDLIDEVRLLWNTLIQQGEALHSEGSITMGMRAVLEFLSRNGRMTVPDIARARRVTRQHIQALVNALLDEALVQRVPNPAHSRSPVIALTPAGDRAIHSMRRKEARLLRGANVRVSSRDLERTTTTLRAFRSAIDR